MNTALEAARPAQLPPLGRLPLLWISLAFLCGVVMAGQVALPFGIWLAFGCLALGLAFFARRSPLPFFQKLRERYAWAPLLAAALASGLLGAARYQLATPRITPSHVAFFNDRAYDVLVTGWLTEPPDERDTYSNLRLQVQAVDTGDGDLPAGGLLLARVDANHDYPYGQVLRLRGRLQTPPEDEDFSYRDYLARQGILSYMPSAEATVLPARHVNLFWTAIYSLQRASLARVYRLFPDPEASLLAGILLGVDSGMTRQLRSAFQDTGTAHIIAISGFNMTIIAGLFVVVFGRLLGKWRGAAAALIGIVLYTLLVGANPAVMRAALMGGLVLIAHLIGRRVVALNTLLFAAALLALGDPLVLGDVGFQFSFFATLGIVLYTEPLAAAVLGLIARLAPAAAVALLTGPVTEFLIMTIAAQLSTLPLTAYYFQRLLPVSLIANAFILPAQPAVMILGGIAVMFGLIALPLGKLVAAAAWPFVLYTVRTVEVFDSLPLTTIHVGRLALVWVVLAYAALLSVTFGWKQVKEALAWMRARAQSVGLAGVVFILFACSIVAWQSALRSGDGRLHVTFLDVGSADAVLIQTPSGRYVLINGGESTSMLSDQLGRRLPGLRRRLDWLVIASTSEEQVAALPRVLDRYPPQQVLWAGNLEASYSARQVDVWLADHAVPVTPAAAGQSLDLGEGARLEILAVGARGSVLSVEWMDFRLVIPIGIDPDILTELEDGKTIGQTDVLLLADSGYAASNPRLWIENLDPGLLVLSVAAGDIEGRPDRRLIAMLEGYTLLRTDRNGWISISTDGETMHVEVEKVVQSVGE